MDDLITWLLNFAWNRGIGYTLTRELSPTTPSCALPQSNQIIINLNWHKEKELPFQIAHEIGHCLNHDVGACYYTSSSKSKVEHQANLAALRILLYYCDLNDIDYCNYVSFSNRFGIPTKVAESLFNGL